MQHCSPCGRRMLAWEAMCVCMHSCRVSIEMELETVEMHLSAQSTREAQHSMAQEGSSMWS